MVSEQIRLRTIADLPACVDLLGRVHETEGYPIRWPAEPRAWLDPPGSLAVWVAEAGSAVTGHVCVGLREPGVASLERLFVDPAAHRRGTGRRLVATCVAWAADQGLRLVLDVTDRPGPLAFYASLGWRETGRTPIDWGDEVASCVVRLEHG